MIKLIRKLILLPFFLTYSFTLAAQNQHDFVVERFQLSNGLQVVLLPSNRAPIVTQMILYQVGSADEEPGKSGLAHFLEHLMFKATKNFPEGFYDQEIQRVGGEANAFTTDDYTVYHQTVSSEFLEMLMKLEAERMQHLIIHDPGFTAEKQVVREEIRLNHTDPPTSRLYRMMMAMLFIHHPYGTPVIGWDHEVTQLTAVDAENFYRRWYSPSNAILLIAGDIQVPQVRQLVEKYYGPIPAFAVPARTRLQEPALAIPRQVEFASANTQEFRWWRFYKIPSPGTTEALPLELIAQILGGNSNSRLYKRLVMQEKLVSNISVSFDTSNRDYATLNFYASASSSEQFSLIEKIINEEINKLKNQPVSQGELEQAKTQLENAAIKSHDNISSLGEYILVGLTTGWTLEDLQNWSNSIRQVHPEQLQKQAQQYLLLENSVTGTLLPQPK